MTDRSVETSAAAATGADADPSEGMGLAQPAAHGDNLVAGTPGEAGDGPVPARDERPGTGDAEADAPTEGARSVQAGYSAATEQGDTP
jgi:hypothetical protein